MDSFRPPAVAGSFYPGTTEALSRSVTSLLSSASSTEVSWQPKALVVPHAGYPYSGPVAGAAYRLLEPWASSTVRVVVLGPVHRVPIRGLALPTAAAFETPLGRVPVDPEAGVLLTGLARTHGEAHALEHSVEVQLPFLQTVLPAFRLIPLVVGEASVDQVVAVVDRLWGGRETLFVISTDLSHYLPYDRAVSVDARTASVVERLESVGRDDACGSVPLNGFLATARSRRMAIHRVALANSGDTAGDRSRVVGYGSWALVEANHGA